MRHKRLRLLGYVLGLAALAVGAATSSRSARGTDCVGYTIHGELTGVTEDGVPVATPPVGDMYIYARGPDTFQLIANPSKTSRASLWRENYRVASVAPCP